MRQRRALLKMSQARLAAAVGLTVQQIRKYEGGQNRITASRLYELAGALGVGVSFFFKGLPRDALNRRASGKKLHEHGTPFVRNKDPLASSETRELVRAYESIRDPSVRRGIFNLVKKVGAASHSHLLSWAELPNRRGFKDPGSGQKCRRADR